MVGDMGSLLDITLQENKLQTKMDKLNAKIDKLVEIIQEKEAMLKSFKQEKETVSISETWSYITCSELPTSTILSYFVQFFEVNTTVCFSTLIKSIFKTNENQII